MTKGRLSKDLKHIVKSSIRMTVYFDKLTSLHSSQRNRIISLLSRDTGNTENVICQGFLKKQKLGSRNKCIFE